MIPSCCSSGVDDPELVMEHPRPGRGRDDPGHDPGNQQQGTHGRRGPLKALIQQDPGDRPEEHLQDDRAGDKDQGIARGQRGRVVVEHRGIIAQSDEPALIVVTLSRAVSTIG